MVKVAGINKIGVILCLLVISFSSFGQITSGRIVFERKTNLEKKFTDERMKQWLRGNTSKTDNFELIFNDTISIFKPILIDEVDRLDWTTSKSTVLQNFTTDNKLTVLDI